MAMSITVADNADVDPYEGELIDATWTDTHRDEVGLQAEAFLCNLVEYDIVTNWATLGAVTKIIFTEYVARTIAIQGILFNTAAYVNGLEETENMITISQNKLDKIEEMLAKQTVQDFLGV